MLTPTFWKAVCAFSLPDIASSIVARSRTSAVFASSADAALATKTPCSVASLLAEVPARSASSPSCAKNSPASRALLIATASAAAITPMPAAAASPRGPSVASEVPTLPA